MYIPTAIRPACSERQFGRLHKGLKSHASSSCYTTCKADKHKTSSLVITVPSLLEGCPKLALAGHDMGSAADISTLVSGAT